MAKLGLPVLTPEDLNTSFINKLQIALAGYLETKEAEQPKAEEVKEPKAEEELKQKPSKRGNDTGNPTVGDARQWIYRHPALWNDWLGAQSKRAASAPRFLNEEQRKSLSEGVRTAFGKMQEDGSRNGREGSANARLADHLAARQEEGNGKPPTSKLQAFLVRVRNVFRSLWRYRAFPLTVLAVLVLTKLFTLWQPVLNISAANSTDAVIIIVIAAILLYVGFGHLFKTSKRGNSGLAAIGAMSWLIGVVGLILVLYFSPLLVEQITAKGVNEKLIQLKTATVDLQDKIEDISATADETDRRLGITDQEIRDLTSKYDGILIAIREVDRGNDLLRDELRGTNKLIAAVQTDKTPDEIKTELTKISSKIGTKNDKSTDTVYGLLNNVQVKVNDLETIKSDENVKPKSLPEIIQEQMAVVKDIESKHDNAMEESVRRLESIEQLGNTSVSVQNLANTVSSFLMQGMTPMFLVIVAVCAMFATMGLITMLRWAKNAETVQTVERWNARVETLAKLSSAFHAAGVKPPSWLNQLAGVALEDGPKSRTTPKMPVQLTMEELTKLVRELKS